MLRASAKWLFGGSIAGTRDGGAPEFPAVIKGSMVPSCSNFNAASGFAFELPTQTGTSASMKAAAERY